MPDFPLRRVQLWVEILCGTPLNILICDLFFTICVKGRDLVP